MDLDRIALDKQAYHMFLELYLLDVPHDLYLGELRFPDLVILGPLLVHSGMLSLLNLPSLLVLRIATGLT
jgi:hypothetical protein